MASKIVITENQYSNLLNSIKEQTENNPLFKSTYNPEDKSVIVSYYVMDETPNSFIVVNPKEYKKPTEWADGAQDYDLKFDIAQLPKSKTEVMGSIPDFPQFKIFKIPYWLYKKEPKLDMRRLEGNKRMSSPKDDVIFLDIRKMNIEDAFIALGGDTNKLKRGLERVWMKSKKPNVDVGPSSSPMTPSSIFGPRDIRYTGD